VTKGEDTRAAILDRASVLARTIGLSGLTIGRLAEEMSLSKSGLFAHFGSKESLQVEVMHATREQFIERVVVPALKEKRGEPRVRALFDRWLQWGAQSGGCVMTTAAIEFDDQDGPVRVEVAAAHRDWMGTVAQAARIAVDEGHFARDLDPEQFAFEVQGIALAWHQWFRLLRDPKATERARRAFAALVERSRAAKR
jgi:AcrR family transcriptional regulator